MEAHVWIATKRALLPGSVEKRPRHVMLRLNETTLRTRYRPGWRSSDRELRELLNEPVLEAIDDEVSGTFGSCT
jgi:hypothetical protein